MGGQKVLSGSGVGMQGWDHKAVTEQGWDPGQIHNPLPACPCPRNWCLLQGSVLGSDPILSLPVIPAPTLLAHPTPRHHSLPGRSPSHPPS